MNQKYHIITVDRSAKMSPGSSASRKALVLIHGIYSNHEAAFRTMMKAFELDDQFDDWEISWFDYRFHQPIYLSGLILNQALANHFAGWTDQDKVVLVCHSMGGLVARFAALNVNNSLPFLKKIIMLGTPNCGAVRTSKMAICAQLMMSTAKKVFGVFSRKQGILDLTQVTRIFDGHLSEVARKNVERVEYITIPGLFFNETRGLFEPGDWGEWRGRKNWFAPLRVGIDAIGTFLPLWKIGLEIPHDGIVEESSNRMIPAPGVLGYVSEKTSQIDFPEMFSSHTYAHVIHEACRELTHVTLQHDERIIELVSTLIRVFSLDQWFKDVMSSSRFRSLTPRPRFHKPAPSPHQLCG